jgi:AraC-like DNA-binding protein
MTTSAAVPPPTEDARGVLDAERLFSEVRFERFAPSAALAPIVDWFWVVEWDRRETGPCEQYTLPHPVVNVVLAPEYARAYGVMRRRFARRLEGRGRAVAAKFRPGGFRELLGGPLSAITDRDLPATQVLGDAVADLHRAIHRADGAMSTPDAVAAFDALLVARAGGAPGTHPVTPVTELAADDSAITRVEHLADRTGWSPRQLQRMFSDAVGVGPKWVIRRHRLLEAAERARVDAAPDWARVAHDLGFSDQAHLVRSFTELVGVPPARYAREGVAGAR